MPESAHIGNKKADVLALNSLCDESGSNLSHAFVGMKRDGTSFQAVPNLQALEWLKAAPDDNKRRTDRISIDKVGLAKSTGESIGAYIEDEETGAPIGQQRDVLRIMYEQHFSEEDIEIVEAAFQTSNVLRRQQIRKLVRRVVKAKRENAATLGFLNELVALAQAEKNKPDDRLDYDHVRQTLFYVSKNE